MPKHEPETNINKEQQALKLFVASKQQDIVIQRQKAMADKGMKEFIKFPEGETEFTLDPVIPRERDGNFGKQSIFRIRVHNVEYDWSVNHKSPVYRQIIGDGLKNKGLLLDAPIKVKLVKVGEGQTSRMTLKKT